LINKTLSALRLEWRGQSADEQEEISSEWTRVCGELFGPKDNPDTGVLSALAHHVTTAAKNYALAERAAIGIFDQILDGIAKQDDNEAKATEASTGAPNPDLKFQQVMRELAGNEKPLDHTKPGETAIFTDYPDA
jgi:hypothetical protein